MLSLGVVKRNRSWEREPIGYFVKLRPLLQTLCKRFGPLLSTWRRTGEIVSRNLSHAYPSTLTFPFHQSVAANTGTGCFTPAYLCEWTGGLDHDFGSFACRLEHFWYNRYTRYSSDGRFWRTKPIAKGYERNHVKRQRWL